MLSCIVYMIFVEYIRKYEKPFVILAKYSNISFSLIQSCTDSIWFSHRFFITNMAECGVKVLSHCTKNSHIIKRIWNIYKKMTLYFRLFFTVFKKKFKTRFAQFNFLCCWPVIVQTAKLTYHHVIEYMSIKLFENKSSYWISILFSAVFNYYWSQQL